MMHISICTIQDKMNKLGGYSICHQFSSKYCKPLVCIPEWNKVMLPDVWGMEVVVLDVDVDWAKGKSQEIKIVYNVTVNH